MNDTTALIILILIIGALFFTKAFLKKRTGGH